MSTPKADASEKLWPLIRHLRYPVLTTRSRDGALHSRPVALQNRELDGLDFLWLFAQRESAQVDDLQWDSSAGIVFTDANKGAYVVIFGSAAVVGDIGRKRALWSPQAPRCFAGPEDPGLALIRVRIIQADHWNVESNSATRIFKLDNSPPPFKVAIVLGSSGVVH
jgi:general stress protein 26